MARFSPVASFLLATLLFAVGAAIAGLLLWRSYDDVPARMWILLAAVGLVSLLAGAATRVGSVLPAASILVAALVPVAGLVVVLAVGALARMADVTSRLPVEPTTLAWTLAPWLPLWAVLSAVGAWMSRPRVVQVRDDVEVVDHRT